MWLIFIAACIVVALAALIVIKKIHSQDIMTNIIQGERGEIPSF